MSGHKISRSTMLASSLAPLPFLMRPVSAQTNMLRIATDPFDSYAEAYYATDMGFFKRAALNIKLVTFASGGAIATAVAAGAADIGISNPVQLANAIGHGVPFTVIAGGGMYSSKAPTTLLCVARDSTFARATDLNGKTIGVSALKDILYLAAKAYLVQQGADVATIHFVEIPFAEMGAALQRGTIAAALLVEPALQDALDKGQVRIVGTPYDAIAPRFLIGAWFSTVSFVAANAPLVNRFVAAIYETARWANKNKPASAEILAKYSKLLPATTLRMRRVLYAESLSPALIQPMLDISLRNGVLEREVSATQMISSNIH